MLSYEEERQIRWEQFRNKYGHYPDEKQCNYCNNYYIKNIVHRVRDLFPPQSSFLNPYIKKLLICDLCLHDKQVLGDVKKRLLKHPVQLSLPLVF